MTTRRTRAACSPAARARPRGRCLRHGRSAAAVAHRGTAAAPSSPTTARATEGGAEAAPPARSTPSASSSSARRTTSATTRPPTRAATPSRKRSPTSRSSRPRTCPRPPRPKPVMEDMIDDGADLIFATSYGHLDSPPTWRPQQPRRRRRPAGRPRAASRSTTSAPTSARSTSRSTPPASRPARSTESDKLGYVYAFPIPQTLANINAFKLGAQSVNPDAETITISTGSWCDPALQAQAAQSLLDQGVDVITQHQDCTTTIIEAAEAAGALLVGYHADASELAPEGLDHRLGVGLGPALHRHRADRRRRRASPRATTTATSGSACRPATTRSSSRRSARWSTDETKASDRRGQAGVLDGGSPFAGPVTDQDGEVVWAEGETAHLRRRRDDGLLRPGRHRVDRLTARLHTVDTVDVVPMTVRHLRRLHAPAASVAAAVGGGARLSCSCTASGSGRSPSPGRPRALAAAGRRVHRVARPGYGARRGGAADLDDQVDIVARRTRRPR